MSAALSRLMSAAAGVLRTCRPRYTRDEESHFDELASALSDMEGEVAGPFDLDEPVGTTADELVTPAEAFIAGAEYMRQKTIVMGWINHPDQPPVAVQPLAREVEAAAASYMEARR